MNRKEFEQWAEKVLCKPDDPFFHLVDDIGTSIGFWSVVEVRSAMLAGVKAALDQILPSSDLIHLYGPSEWFPRQDAIVRIAADLLYPPEVEPKVPPTREKLEKLKAIVAEMECLEGSLGWEDVDKSGRIKTNRDELQALLRSWTTEIRAIVEVLQEALGDE